MLGKELLVRLHDQVGLKFREIIEFLCQPKIEMSYSEQNRDVLFGYKYEMWESGKGEAFSKGLW
jgi:hypothetical protein